MKHAYLTALIAATVLALAVVPAVRASTGIATELVWANGTARLMVVPEHAPVPIPASSTAHENFYEEAPQSATPQGTEGFHLGFFGATIPHDHTVPAQAQNSGTFGVIWHVLVLLQNTMPCNTYTATPAYYSAGPSAIRRCLAASGVGGALLTSVSNIEAAETAGLIVEADTGIVFVCPIT